MMMLSKILAAVDGSDASKRAFEYASFLAEKCNTSLLIVNIADVFERVGSYQHSDNLRASESQS